MWIATILVAGALAGSPAPGLVPLGAAPLEAGQGTVTVSGGGLVVTAAWVRVGGVFGPDDEPPP